MQSLVQASWKPPEFRVYLYSPPSQVVILTVASSSCSKVLLLAMLPTVPLKVADALDNQDDPEHGENGNQDSGGNLCSAGTVEIGLVLNGIRHLIIRWWWWWWQR